MHVLGLELRKSSDIESLYKDVDSVLSKHGMVSGEVSIKVATQTVAHSLQKMLKQNNWFDVCVIKNCADAAAIQIPSTRQAIYQAAHCISWGDMTADYKEILVAMVMDDFRSLFQPVKE